MRSITRRYVRVWHDLASCTGNQSVRIGKHERDTSGKSMRLAKGAISKTIRKLAGKHLMEPYMQGGDRHKVCHRVAATGREGYEKHGMRDGRWKQIDNEFLLNLSDEERQKAICYLKKYMMLFRNE